MKKTTNFIKQYWITAVLFVVLAALYTHATNVGALDPVLFPTVEKIGNAITGNIDLLAPNFVSSMAILIPSLIIGCLVALGLGIPMGLYGRFRKTIYPLIYAISVIPAILLSPFALHMMPNFFSASIFLIVYGSIWATLFSTVNGIMTIDRRYFDNADTLKLTGFKRLIHVILPAAMPSIMSGMVTSLRGAFLMLCFAEMYGSQYGMGYFVKRNADMGLFDNMWAGFIFMTIVLVIIMQLFEQFKNYVLRWTID